MSERVTQGGGNLVSCNPTGGSIAGGFTVDVVGTGSPPFVAGLTEFVVGCNQTNVVAPAVIHSPTSATITMPFSGYYWTGGGFSTSSFIECWANGEPDPNGYSGWRYFEWLTVAEVDSFTPAAIPLAGGVSVTCYGSGLYSVTQVTVGGALVAFTAIDDNTLTFAAPAQAAGGAVPVGVTNQAGTLTFDVNYANPPAPIPGAIPPGRGRWRLTLHHRQFIDTPWQQTVIAELTRARSVLLTQLWNQPAKLDFTLDGESPEAPLVLELGTDVIAWRWDEGAQRDVPMFRGLVDHSQDTVTEDAATATFTCHDYSAMLSRRILNIETTMFSQQDQDYIVSGLVTQLWFSSPPSGSGSVWFQPGDYLPIHDAHPVAPDGSGRAASGQLRDRTYYGSQNVGQAISDLAAVINGFDFAIAPLFTDSYDMLLVYYPRQGVTRSDIGLVYGATVSGLTRTVDSTTYANYIRLLGNNTGLPAGTQLFSEAFNPDTNNVTVNPVGLWMTADNAATVIDQPTLDQTAQGELNLDGLLVPTYAVTMRPDAYRYGFPNMGDTVPLVVKVGRLNVNTTVRVLGITYTVGDDGQEDVTLTLGRPLTTLADAFTQADRDVDALVRR